MPFLIFQPNVLRNKHLDTKERGSGDIWRP